MRKENISMQRFWSLVVNYFQICRFRGMFEKVIKLCRDNCFSVVSTCAVPPVEVVETLEYSLVNSRCRLPVCSSIQGLDMSDVCLKNILLDENSKFNDFSTTWIRFLTTLITMSKLSVSITNIHVNIHSLFQLVYYCRQSLCTTAKVIFILDLILKTFIAPSTTWTVFTCNITETNMFISSNG